MLRETYGNTVLDFFYAGGTPYALKHNGTLYYYITNLQGDVMSIVDEQGNVVASYEYDPYGNVISATGDLAEVNPLRYRGYYYDTEIGMYYLQSRYYDPELGRFINADDTTYLGANGTPLSYNLFAYCENNPIYRKDNSGKLWGAIIGGAIAGAIIGVVSNIVSCGLSGEDITVGGILTAAATGAATGAIGAAAGVVEGARTVCSVVVGLISGVTTAITTEGTVGEKIDAGIKTAVVATVGTYLGAGIPTLTDCGRFAEGMTAFAGTLFSGTQTELANAFIP